MDYESAACLGQMFDWLEEVLIQVIWGFTAVGCDFRCADYNLHI
ncbi:hypothetical protein COLO4_04699 [Corchorus olitorius]|uniref:Uncharacterized protein n=1 Tax=Corchorus olitorius TaxID=93759 RepID=A0A1R3KT27_9ROSI|nr:hypothetical protein COLO4_04699 [Corchorus olitorius]